MILVNVSGLTTMVIPVFLLSITVTPLVCRVSSVKLFVSLDEGGLVKAAKTFS